MNDDELQKLVEKISLEYFAIPFKHKATFNNRLITTGGRYFPNSHHLEFNHKSYETYGLEELIGIIKHELCHYHLHLQKRGYLHRDRSFKECLKKVKGSRFSKPLKNHSRKKYIYELKCTKCNQLYYRRKRITIHKYRCGKCGGPLTMKEIE